MKSIFSLNCDISNCIRVYIHYEITNCVNPSILVNNDILCGYINGQMSVDYK